MSPVRNVSIRIATVAAAVVCGVLLTSCNKAETEQALIPEIDGEWWQISGNPDLGELTGETNQQPVDFGIWKAADGTWQLWSCIRHTKEAGSTRLFHGWEAENLTDTNWRPTGIKMRADSTLGETPGGLQAPFVFEKDGTWQMFYGDWKRICRATSTDGKNFTRVIQDGTSMTFGDPDETNSRDPMVLKIGDTYYTYYTAHPDNRGAVYVRTSTDLETWSTSTIAAFGGQTGNDKFWYAECPFVVEYAPGDYFLFRTQSYGDGLVDPNATVQKTSIYRSPDPTNFGVEDDQFFLGTLEVAAPEIVKDGEDWYIAALIPGLTGIRMAKLAWVEDGAIDSDI